MKHLLPKEAWARLQQDPNAVLIDVRMKVEFDYVGHPPEAINIPWFEFPSEEPDIAAFLAAVQAQVPEKTRCVVLLCRSGSRTVKAARVLDAAGYTEVINVLDGFEGELDDDLHRGTETGWRFCGLPWVQA